MALHRQGPLLFSVPSWGRGPLRPSCLELPRVLGYRHAPQELPLHGGDAQDPTPVDHLFPQKTHGKGWRPEW